MKPRYHLLATLALGYAAFLSAASSRDIDIAWKPIDGVSLQANETTRFVVLVVADPATATALPSVINSNEKTDGKSKIRGSLDAFLSSVAFRVADPSLRASLTSAYGLPVDAAISYLTARGSLIYSSNDLLSEDIASRLLSDLAGLDERIETARASLSNDLKALDRALKRVKLSDAAKRATAYEASIKTAGYDDLCALRRQIETTTRATIEPLLSDAQRPLLAGDSEEALKRIETLEATFEPLPFLMSEISAVKTLLNDGKTGTILTDWQFGGALGAVYYTTENQKHPKMGAQFLAEFESIGQAVSSKLGLPYRQIHAGDVLGDDTDTNGCLIYPDGMARTRLLIMPGGNAHYVFYELGGGDLKPYCKGRIHIQSAFKSGMNYVGSCGGFFNACSGDASPDAFVHNLQLWPGKTKLPSGAGMEKPHPDISLDPGHPLASGVPGGKLTAVFFNGGPAWVEPNVKGTEYIGYFSAGGLTELIGSPAVIAYQSPNRQTGRVVVCAAHPESSHKQFMRSMADYALETRYALPRRPIEAGKTIINVSGDKQWQYYEINVPSNVTALTATLDEMDGNCDLYIKHGWLPAEKDNDKASKRSAKSNETISLKPKPGIYFIGVFGNHDVLNGVNYNLTVTVSVEPDVK